MQIEQIGPTHDRTAPELAHVRLERMRQDAKFPTQPLEHDDDTAGMSGDATRLLVARLRERIAKIECDAHKARGLRPSFRLILDEEVAEVDAAVTLEDLHTELVQVAAVAVKWAEAVSLRIKLRDDEQRKAAPAVQP